MSNGEKWKEFGGPRIIILILKSTDMNENPPSIPEEVNSPMYVRALSQYSSSVHNNNIE